MVGVVAVIANGAMTIAIVHVGMVFPPFQMVFVSFIISLSLIFGYSSIAMHGWRLFSSIFNPNCSCSSGSRGRTGTCWSWCWCWWSWCWWSWCWCCWWSCTSDSNDYPCDGNNHTCCRDDVLPAPCPHLCHHRIPQCHSYQVCLIFRSS